MNHASSAGGAVRTLRRNINSHLQLLILPSIIMLLLAVLFMKGCGASEKTPSASPGMLSFSVEGMGCPGCAQELAEVLRALQGVKDARVSFEKKKAFVTLDHDHPASMESIEAALAERQEEHSKLESDPKCTKPKG